MARIEWVEQRLDRWAEWIARGKACGRGTLAMFKGIPVDADRPLQGLSLDEAECFKTDKAIRALPGVLPETVSHYYLSGSMAAQDRMRISRAVLSTRITQAHRMLAQAWEEEKAEGVLNR